MPVKNSSGTRAKLWVGFGTLVLVLLISDLAIVLRLLAMEDEIHQVSTLAEPTAEAARQMESRVVGTGLRVMNYLSTRDPAERASVTRDAASFHDDARRYAALVPSEESRSRAKEVGALYDRFRMLGESLMDRADALKAIQAESRGLDRDIDTIGKMSSRPIAENQAAARAFDGTAVELEMMAAKAMDRQVGLLVVICSAIRDIDAKLAEARGAVANEASAAARGQSYDRTLAGAASQVFLEQTNGPLRGRIAEVLGSARKAVTTVCTSSLLVSFFSSSLIRSTSLPPLPMMIPGLDV